MYNSVARLHTRMSLLFLFNSCSIRAATGSTALLYTKCRVSRAITCARETEVEGEPRQLVVRSKQQSFLVVECRARDNTSPFLVLFPLQLGSLVSRTRGQNSFRCSVSSSFVRSRLFSPDVFASSLFLFFSSSANERSIVNPDYLCVIKSQ